MKRAKRLVLLDTGEKSLKQYEQRLCLEVDLAVAEAYDPLLTKPHAQDITPLFCSAKRHARLTERGSSYLVKKYVEGVKLCDVNPHVLCHRFGYRTVATVLLHQLAQLMDHDSLDTTMLSIQRTTLGLQLAIEKITWL